MGTLTLVCTLVLCGVLVVSVSAVCQDLDSKACALIETANPNMCQDPSVTTKACPRYCNKCPLTLTCYDCPTPVSSISNNKCSTTTACAKGELCMLRGVTSSTDGHHEFIMAGCSTLQECDGFPASVVNIVGRRNVKQRNVAISCCSHELCNTPTAQTTLVPTTPTTTTVAPVPTTIKPPCARDILVMKEYPERDQHFQFMNTELRNILISMVHDIEIGPTANLLQVSAMDSDVETIWDLNDYMTKTDLLQAINRLPSHHRTNRLEAKELINYIKTAAFSIHSGDRYNVPNDIIVFVDYRMRLDQSLTSAGWTKAEMDRISSDVIIVNIGGSPGVASALDVLATDRHHVLQVTGYDTLYTAKQQLLALICE